MNSNASQPPRGAFPRGPTDIPRSIFRRVARPAVDTCSRPAALLVLIAMCGLPGCAFNTSTLCGRSALHSTPSQPHVEIFRGLGGWMPGSDRLQQRLAARGIASTVSYGAAARCVSRRILERRARGNSCPIVLMGYATGGGGVKRVAEDLAQHGVCVDAIILLDPSFFEPVPSNVRYCFVAYRPEVLQAWNSIMRGNPVRTESPKTAVQLVNLEESDPLGLMQTNSHLTITTDEWVQQILVRQATAVFCCACNDRRASRVSYDDTPILP